MVEKPTENTPNNRGPLVFGVLAAALCLVTVGSVLWFRFEALFTVDAVTVEGRSPGPVSEHHRINLFDGRTVTQTFRATARQLSHIGIGASPLSASGDAILTLELAEENGTPLASGTIPAHALRAIGATRIPLPLYLQEGALYQLRISTRGINQARAIALWYEPSRKHFSDGDARIQHANGNIEQLSGNIRFEIVRLPTRAVLFDAFRHSAAFPIFIAAAVVLGTFFLSRVRRFLGAIIARPLDLPVYALHRKEIFITASIGVLLAGVLTLPLYTSLNKTATYVDPNRALVYHGVARDALLHDGEVAQWDPYLCGGVPLLGNPESTHVNPFFLLVLPFGEDIGLRLSVTATLAIGFIGTAFLARRTLGADLPSMLLAGAVFAFSGFFVWWFSSGAFALFPMAWIPWFLLGFWESLRRTLWIPLTAIMLALLLLGGFPHALVYAVITVGILVAWFTLVFRHPRPVIAFACIVALAVPVTAIKLLPITEVQALSADFVRLPTRILPITLAPKLFLARDQYTYPSWTHIGAKDLTTMSGTGPETDAVWQEYETYVGIIPMLTALVGAVFLFRQRLALVLLGTGGTLFAMTFGYFPWTILHRLPFLNETLRSPARFRGLFILFLALFAAAGLTIALRRIRPAALRACLGFLVLGLAIADLFLLHQPLFRRTFATDAPVLPVRETFTRVRDSYTDDRANHYRLGHLNYRANEGTTDLCIPHMSARGVFARGIDSSNPKKPYQGEAFLEQGGEAHLTELRPNAMTVAITPPHEGWLVLNQNFFPGWSSSPEREIGQRDGRLAVRVVPDDRVIRLSYRSLSYHTGRAVTLIALVLVGVWFWRERVRA